MYRKISSFILSQHGYSHCYNCLYRIVSLPHPVSKWPLLSSRFFFPMRTAKRTAVFHCFRLYLVYCHCLSFNADCCHINIRTRKCGAIVLERADTNVPFCTFLQVRRLSETALCRANTLPYTSQISRAC